MLPSWQRSGIGKGLVERLVNAMLADGVPVVSLFAEPRVVGLYEKLGFMQVTLLLLTSTLRMLGQMEIVSDVTPGCNEHIVTSLTLRLFAGEVVDASEPGVKTN